MRDDSRGIAFDLTLLPSREAVLHGEGGFSRKSADGAAASQYYSLPRLATEGTLRDGGRAWQVRGESWMDHEFTSSLLSARQVGWDWFSLRLRDGRDLMLFVLRKADGGEDFRSGTLVAASGAARGLGATEWALRPTGRWRSAASGAEYPSGWTLEMPGEGLRIRIAPDLPDQENRGVLGGGISYWEGSVTASTAEGQDIGRGYAELTGYAKDARPPM